MVGESKGLLEVTDESEVRRAMGDGDGISWGNAPPVVWMGDLVEVGESTSFSSSSADLERPPFVNPPASTLAPVPKTALEAAVASSVDVDDPANIVFLTSLLPRAIVDRREG